MPTRRFVVSRAEGGRSIADVLASQLNLPPAEARRLVQSGRVRLSAVACPDPGRRVAPGQTVERRYLALVRGVRRAGRVESNLVRDRGDGRRGSSDRAADGQPAVTHVRVLEDLGEFALVECRLETGRTHQVRIHLGELGTPLCGERVYDRPLNGQALPDESGAARQMLHAATLGIEHPATGERKSWHSPLPADMKSLLNRLRHRRPR